MPGALLVDTDPGSDDAVAILMALASQRVEVAGITTVGGNCRLSEATRNALSLLEAVGRGDVPVAVGCRRPLKGRYRYSYYFHGKGGLPLRLPAPARRPVAQHAVDFLAGQVGRLDRPLLVALGPLTNVARLMMRHHGVKEGLGGLVVMGGAVGGRGNATRHAEFNFYNDPYAAHLVLNSGVPLTLVDLAACRRASITRRGALRLQRGNDFGRLAGRVLSAWFGLHPGRRRYDLCDPLAMGVALETGMVETRGYSISVVWSEPDRLGLSWPRGEGDVHVPARVDAGSFFGAFYRLLGAR